LPRRSKGWTAWIISGKFFELCYLMKEWILQEHVGWI
jgi:hypothetical protein